MVDRIDSHSNERGSVDREEKQQVPAVEVEIEAPEPEGAIPAPPYIVESNDEYHWRFIVEYRDFNNLTRRHVEMLLATFDIKNTSLAHVERLRQSTPYFRNLLPWDLILGVLRNIAVPGSIRFGALDPSLTRRDLDNLQNRARDLARLYAPIRYVAFEFRSTLTEAQLRQQLDAISGAQLNAAQPVAAPNVRETRLEARPANPPSGLPPVADIRAVQQEFLLSPADGIGARDVWDKPGGKGYGVHYVDIEYGWQLQHRDLPEIQAPNKGTYSYHLDDDAEQDHGTAMIGIISAKHNDLDTFGIAPEANGHVLSQLRERNLVNLPGAINQACATILRPGDILLIEAQTKRDGGPYMPVERESEVFAAIEFGVTLGVTIIEPAGNGSSDLDKVPGFPINGRDSGAILVAAAMKDNAGNFVPWTSGKHGTNYGRRVNCFAWGAALGSLTNDLTQSVKAGQGGTSAASAIIAGAAILAQSLYRARFKDGSSIWPDEMRTLLSDPASTQAPGQAIGVMPNLGQIDADLKPATVPGKVEIPKSLREALFGTGKADGSGIPRLATIGSYS